MAFTCGFFDSLSGDRKYNAKQISEIFDGVIRDGVYASIGTRFLVEPGTGMQITINTGRAWFNHTWTLNDAKFPLTIELADLILDRIDAVVLEVNSSLEIRNNQFKVVKGTPSSNPQKPKMTNTEFIHQYALAYIRVKKNVTSITTSDIEINVGKTDCPFVTSILEAADISSLYSQWESQFRDWENEQKTGFEEWLVAKKNGFDTWFDEMKGQLSEDAAGNLQLQMDEKGIQIYTHSKEGTIHKFVGNGPNGRALMTDNVAAGDTFQVNGSPVTAYMGADNAVDVMAGNAYSGKWVTFVFENSVLNFKGGGGGKVTVSGLSAAAIKTGVTVTVKQGEKNIQTVTGTFTSDATARASLILMGYTAYIKGEKVAGTMPYYNEKTFTPTSYDQYLHPGYFLNGMQTIKGDLNLAGQNILKGKSIFGKLGTLTCLAAWITKNEQIYGFHYDFDGQYKLLNAGPGIIMDANAIGGIPVFCTIKPYKTTYAYTIEVGAGVFIINPGQTNVIESELTGGGRYIKQNVVNRVENLVFVLGYQTV